MLGKLSWFGVSCSIYVNDGLDIPYHRVTRWKKGATQGEIIVGGNDAGNQANQLNSPVGLYIDTHGNLFVADYNNHRVQRFSIV